MGYSILIVDDSSIIREIIAKTIRLTEIDVSELLQAENGEEALKTLKNKWVDIVFADICMPVMDGMELIEKMKSDAVLKSIPVAVVSTEGSDEKTNRLMELGIISFLRKPFTPEQLVRVIHENLKGD